MLTNKLPPSSQQMFLKERNCMVLWLLKQRGKWELDVPQGCPFSVQITSSEKVRSRPAVGDLGPSSQHSSLLPYAGNKLTDTNGFGDSGGWRGDVLGGCQPCLAQHLHRGSSHLCCLWPAVLCDQVNHTGPNLWESTSISEIPLFTTYFNFFPWSGWGGRMKLTNWLLSTRPMQCFLMNGDKKLIVRGSAKFLKKILIHKQCVFEVKWNREEASHWTFLKGGMTVAVIMAHPDTPEKVTQQRSRGFPPRAHGCGWGQKSACQGPWLL